LDILKALQDWWNSLSTGTKDNVLGGLIVAVVTGVLAGMWAILKIYFLQLKTNKSTDKELKALSGNIPKPPRQLKNYIQRFDDIGRNLIELILPQLDLNQIVVLWGIGGIGKTTLATEVANKMLPKLPHGVIWISVDGIANFDLLRLQDEICGRLGWIQDVRPYFSDSKAMMAQMLLSQKRCLLVIDSFEIIESSQQEVILNFLSDIAIPVLITSRKHLSGGEHLHIEPMKEKEVKKYIKNLINNSYKKDLLLKINPNEIILSAENNPLYIRWIIRQLEAGLDPTSVLSGSTQLNGDAGERIFGRSFNLLDENSQKVILCLILFTSSASKDALRKVSSLDVVQLDSAMWQLTQLDLIAIENSRPSVTNLVRRLASVSKEFEGEFFTRILDYYVSVAHKFDYFQSATALDAEYENLVGVLEWLLDHQEWHKALVFFGATGEFLTDRSGYEARLRLGNLVLSSAKQANDEKSYAWHAVYTLAWVYLREGKLDQAIPIIETSMTWAKQNNSKDVLALCLRSLGLVEKRHKKLDTAKEYMVESLKIWEEINDRRWIGMTLTYLAEIAVQQEDFQEATTLAEQAWNIFTKLNNEEGLAWASDVLGNIMNKTGKIDRARDYFLKGVIHRERMRAPAGMAHTQMLLANLELNTGNLDQAYGYAQRAYQIYKQLGTTTWIDESLALRKSIQKHLKRNLLKYFWFQTKTQLSKLFILPTSDNAKQGET
jgi:tetratricopeptide (TPR) repeat protein